MDKTISFVILGGGILLVILGIVTSNSFSFDIAHIFNIFTGAPTEGILVGGIVVSITGLAGLVVWA